MATLEVHDGQGQVLRVEISREHAVMFGSSPKCDIVLHGEGVFPFHGRLRWKSPRYKADVFPQAEYIEINGKRMTSGSINQGDEITIGPCRIFMIYADEDLPHDDVTRIQPAPVLGVPQTVTPPKKPSRQRLAVERKERKKEADADLAPAAQALEAVRSARNDKKSIEEPNLESIRRKAIEARPNVFRRFFSKRESAPGEERIVTSPLVIGLVGSLAVLIVLGFFLQGVISRTVASRLFQRGVESLDDGDYRNAIIRFDEYLARKPEDPKHVSKARVFRALANVRQFTTAAGASWANALEAATDMVDKVGSEDAYRDSSTDLDDQVIKAGEALAERAKASGDAKTLAEAESAAGIHARIAGSAADSLLKRSKYPQKIVEARGAVLKAAIRVEALAAMDAAIKAELSSGVYAARDALVRKYGDLAEDRDLVARLTQANDLVRKAVKFDSSRRPAETTPHDDHLGPMTSWVLRWPTMSKPSAASPKLVFALADGVAYALDGSNGAPIWQVPVGLASPFPPQAIPGGSIVLVFDARHQELMRLNSKTGSLVWRQSTEEIITDPPLVVGNQVVQTTPSGKILLIDLASGELRGTLNVGLPLGRTPVSDEAGQFLYVLAEKDCLFILTRDPMGCAAVEYLGHTAGSVPCAPARQGRFLIIPENDTLTAGRLRIFVLDAEGVKTRQAQQLDVPGWSWSTPAFFGSVLWVTGDRGGVSAYAVGAYEAKTPLRPVAHLLPESKPTGPSYALARSENELWVSSSRSGRYDLKPETGKINTTWAVAEAGPAVAPIQVAGPLAVLTQQMSDSSGVLLCGIEPQKGTIQWRTVLGSPWVAKLSSPKPGQPLTTLGIDAQLVSLEPSRLQTGGFVESLLPRPGDFRIPSGPLLRLEEDGLSVLLAGEKPRSLLVGSPKQSYKWVDLPVALGAAPVLWEKGLLIPGEDGRVYLIDPRTGESRAEPYVPPFDREHPTRWRGALRLEDGTLALVDDSGKIRRLTLQTEGRPRLAVIGESTIKERLTRDPVSTGGAIMLTTSDQRIRCLAARDFSPVGAWPLEAPLALPPLSVAGRGFIATKDGKILALGSDGQRLWSTVLASGPPVGPPVIQDQVVSFISRNGIVERRSLSDGSSLTREPLGVIPSGGLVASGSDLLVPVAAGTVRVLSSAGSAKPEGSTP